MSATQLDGWIPIRIYWRGDGPAVDWCWVGARRFSEAFFDQTISSCLELPFSSLFRPQTSIDVLAERYQISRGLEPKGFIFHMSRCGSTLVAQMLAALPGSVVISEARPIDSVLRSRFKDSKLQAETRAEWLKWIVSALGQNPSGDGKNLFIKFDSWNVLDLPVIRAAFPGVPWIFLYREPLDVLISQLGHRGAHMVPGAIEPELFGMTAALISEMQPEEYCAKVLARMCEAAAGYSQTLEGELINYDQLPDAVWTSVAGRFNIELSSSELEALKRRAERDSKNSSLPFDRAQKMNRRFVNDSTRSAAEQWLYPAYGKLEAARLSRKDSQQ